MKILYVHERFGALAGAEANAYITAEELGKRGWETGLLHGPPTGKNEEGWRRVFPARRLVEAADPAGATRRMLEEFAPDIVYVHKMASLSVLRALVESRKPLARMVHDHDIYCMRSYRYNYFTRRICRRPVSPYCLFPCLAFIARNRQGGFPIRFLSYREKLEEVALNRRFDRMVAATTYMRDELILNGFDPKRIEIHAPVPRPGDPNVRSSFSDRNLILYAGQIIRGKGVDVLLRTLARVRKPFECVILGDGNHRPYCEKLTRKLGLNDRVHFKGYVPQEQLKEHYRECSVVALSSVWPEPFAAIGLEVMRYALPVVAFDAGGIRDWLHDGHNGFLVPWMDVAAYARRIEQLLEDKALARRMGEAGLKLVSERYDFHRYIADLDRMFRQIIRERAEAPPGK
ncbi:MAG: glycosyltransferase family 4 protein [Verrucomicrobia bacterium]|nr:glycosyltransferase family 4 protein [Verrucomicrobiota bacterium]